MQSPATCRVLIDAPASGARNMAIDEALLTSGLDGVSTLRFYQWDAATVSLGHFQFNQAVAIPPRFQTLPVVRRLSGGGAILHHHELTYSCALPATHPLSRNPGAIYNIVHDCIIAVLAEHNVTCQMRGDAAFEDQSFLCFARGDARDIVIGSHKIVGSAQRRRQGAILQHGSLLLRKSEWAEEFPGIYELTGQELTAELLIPGLAASIVQALEDRG